MNTTSIRFPPEIVRALEDLAKRRGVGRSEVLREAVEAYVVRKPRTPAAALAEAIDRLVRYRGSGRGDLATNAERYLRERFRAQRRRSR